MSKLAETWKKYKKKDFKRLTWDEYFLTMHVLKRKIAFYIKKNRLTIDAVVPILRGGAIPAAFLAYQLGILKIIPVQYKYFYVGKKAELRSILPLNPANLPQNPVILLVEQNHCFGLTAQIAAQDIKQILPAAKILYAADNMDFSYQKNDYADAIFYGMLTNECRQLSPEQAKAKRIYPFSYIMPWELMQEEWETVNAKQFKYADIKNNSMNCTVKASIDLSGLTK
jgi:hypoxanthine phosphoribosyltransferase